MKRKVRNWTAFLLALVLVFGMIPAAYAAGYSINVEAQEGAILPYTNTAELCKSYRA